MTAVIALSLILILSGVILSLENHVSKLTKRVRTLERLYYLHPVTHVKINDQN